jgi:hypothetical protein
MIPRIIFPHCFSLKNIARYDSNLLLNSPESSSTQQLLQYSSTVEERIITEREEKVGSVSSLNKPNLLAEETETVRTEREEKVGSCLSSTTHRSENHQQMQLQLQQGGGTELTTLSLVLMSSMGMNEEKIVLEGQRKLRKEIRDLEKEQKTDKNGAYIKASERFREIEKLLQLGYKKDLIPQTVSHASLLFLILLLLIRILD